MNAKKCLLSIAIRTSLATSWEESEQSRRDECRPLDQSRRDECRPLTVEGWREMGQVSTSG